MTLKEFKQKINTIPEEFDNLEVLIWNSDHECFTQFMSIIRLKAFYYADDSHLDRLSYSESLKVTPEFLHITFQGDDDFDEFGECMNDSDLVIDLYDD